MIVVAHRGASAYAPENTLSAMCEARRRGADMAELDVRQTADGEFVVMHDPTLRRTTDAPERFPERRPWRVADFTLAEIQTLEAGSWYSPEFAGEPVPTLREALQTLKANGLGALVELKVDRKDPLAARRMARCLAEDPHWNRTSGERPRLIVQSFDWVTMRELGRGFPETPVAVLGMARRRYGLRRVARYAAQVHPHYLRVSEPYVRAAHTHGLAVFSWTVNTAAAIRRVIGNGVDGVISDYPDRVAEHMAVAA
ncbi:glycerophosphodiester phosphodiesterase [Salinactinospora qingdaonensis]|uniref:Hydrolase n=1 Tax=Salinactinospora qingdaonensis TaxID=702744 RepID=A0ABP7EVY7_9ACTN